MKNFKPNTVLKIKYWLLSLLFILPVVTLYFSHYLMSGNGIKATGFIADDMVYYMANAREHFDSGAFQISYGNPFSPFYETPRIYFQPMTIMLGSALYLTKTDPGFIFLVFGVFSAMICVRIAIGLYQEIFRDISGYNFLGLTFFFWGGGLLSITGILFGIKNGFVLNNSFLFDPVNGWWFLNFGRNLIFPTESFYHAIFLGNILLIFKKKYKYSLLLCLFLSISHPFTGIEHILILLSWSWIEYYFLRNRLIPGYFFPCCIALFLYHIGFYGILNLFPEHRQLALQWSLPWTISAENIIPAYCLVGGLTIWRIRSLNHAREFFTDIKNRFFMVWFIVAFTLANHEFFIDPVQPVHFTRGYIWIPLFLMGLKTLVDLFSYIKIKTGKIFRIIIISVIFFVFISDNSIWIATQFTNSYTGNKKLGLYIADEQTDILDWINKNDFQNYIVLCQDPHLSYFLTCYTSLRTWHSSHRFNTPYEKLRLEQLNALFNNGTFIKAWQYMELLVIFKRNTTGITANGEPEWLQKHNGIKIYQNPGYLVYKIPPVKADKSFIKNKIIDSLYP